MDDARIDKYARDCHQLIVVDKGLERDCMSTEELLAARLVASIDRVAELEEAAKPMGMLEANMWKVEHGQLTARVAELELQLAERTQWLVTRLRQTANGIEDRYRPIDEEVPKTKQT